jgi:hypothetical protein
LLNPTDTAVFNAGWLVLFICLPFLLLPVARSEKKDFARSGNRASVRSPNKASTRPPNKAWLVGAAVVALALLLSGAAGALDPDDEFFEGPGGSAVRMSTPLVDGAAAKGAVGSLVGKDGAVAMAVVKPDDADAERLELDVEEIPRAGAYEGKIDLLPDAEGGDATVTANVRDYWPYALVVIALGVGLGAWLSWYFTVKRGRSLVHIKLTTLLGRVDDVSPPPPYSDYAVEERMGARAAAIDKLLESDDPEDTKKAGDEVAAAESYFESVTEMWDQLPKVEEAIELTAAEVTRGKFNVAGDDVPAVFRARDLLRTPFDSDAADTDSALLTARRKAVDDALALLLELCRSLPRAARIRDAADQVSPAPADRIAALRKAVAELVAAGSADDARKSMGTVVGEGSIILEGAKRAEQPEAQALVMAERASVPREALRLGLAAGPPSVPPPEPVLPGPTPRPSAAQLRRRFELTDLQMTTITGVLAVLSGLLALYFTSSTWGAPGDYLKAFLWGSVLSEGIKYVTSLVTRSGPAAG